MGWAGQGGVSDPEWSMFVALGDPVGSNRTGLCYAERMKAERRIFDDPEAEAKADARAEADLAAGRTVSHGAVKRWLQSWGKARPLDRPRAGD